MDVYAENILDHYRHPRGKNALNQATVAHHEVNASCGDEVTLHLQIGDGRVVALGWEGTGCAISQAAMSMLSEELTGKTIEQAAAITPEEVRTMLGVPIGTRRFKCAFLGLHTLKNTLRALENQEPQGWLETVGSDKA